MKDYNSIIRKLANKKIFNQDLLDLPDRNIDNIILNCYSNLYQCRLAAYSFEYADSSIEFRCEFKAQIDKMRSKHKGKIKGVETSDDEIAKLLGMSAVKESINVANLHNSFKILKLKYYIDPVDTINPSLVVRAIDATLNVYDLHTGTYTHKVPGSKEYLYKLRADYMKKIESGEIKPDKTASLDELNEDLFVKEQIVMVPVYDGDGKYTIDGIKYYGVFNNRIRGHITQDGTFGFKAFKNGKINTHYLAIFDNICFFRFFGNYQNPIHAITNTPATEIKSIWDIFPRTDRQELIDVYEATLEHARWLETNDPRVDQCKIRASLPTKESNSRPEYRDSAFVTQVIESITEYIDIMNNPHNRKEMTFEFLGDLESELYLELNTKRIKKNSKIKDAKNRINLPPLDILKIIKKGTGDKVDNTLFISTPTEPNPFDFMYITGFLKRTQHTVTQKNKGKTIAKMSPDSKFLTYDELKYLGEFAPKSEKNIGRATTIRVALPTRLIKQRKPIS